MTVEGSSVAEAEVVIIDAERLVVLARAPVDDQGGFEVSVPQRLSYWLGVSGPYMTTYMDTAFAFTGEAITVDEAPRSDAAGKAAQVVGILGDVNNDNQVDIADALLVLLYTLERFSFVAPNQGNIFLGDVNQDGQIDLADVLLIMTYIANPLDLMLPDGIGVAVAVDQDRAVLIELYGNWGYNTNWLISTYPLDQLYGVTIDDEGRVTSLDLSDNQLTGTIPEALGQLNNLRALDLSDNQLTGTIPEALGQLDSLQTLNLARNALTGTIPEALGQLNNLRALDLSDNQLTGTIPEALGQLDSLQTLNLARNALTGTIPEALGQLNNLEHLFLVGNELMGCIPFALHDVSSNGLAFCLSEIAPEIILYGTLYGTLIPSFTNIFFAVLVGTTTVQGEGGGTVEIAGNEWTFQDYAPDAEGTLIINGVLNVGIDQTPIPLTGTVNVSGAQEAEVMLDIAISLGADGNLSTTGTVTIDGAEFDAAELSAAVDAAAG